MLSVLLNVAQPFPLSDGIIVQFYHKKTFKFDLVYFLNGMSTSNGSLNAKIL